MSKYLSKGNLAAVLIGVLLAVFAGEASLRLFLKGKTVLFPRYHTDAVYGDYTIRKLRPNTTFWHTSVDGSWKFVINSQGFRESRNFPYEKENWVIRVVTLGDSMTEGFEVNQENTYSAVIERYLAEHGVQVEVINMGVSGFSTAEEFVLLENEAIKYHPDYVILGFFANDYEDNVKTGLFSLEDGKLVRNKKIHIPGVPVLNMINEVGILRWLSENSYLYSFGLNTVWDFSKRLLLTRVEERLQTEFAVPTEKMDGYKLQLAELLVQRIFNLCRRNGIRFIIIDIPKASGFFRDLENSIPKEHREVIAANSDGFVDSKEVLEKYRNVAEFHVPHGQRHISEFTHQKLGEEVGKLILGMNKKHEY